jgi:diphthamide synthase (EF-2-diphthine--ammonia ligase)
MTRAAVAAEVIARGIRARVVCVDTRWLDASFCGVDYDAEFIASLSDDVCPCGEGGEFHTFVWDAPGFDVPLAIGPGLRRTVASTPPFAATTLVFEAPRLLTLDDR